MSWSSVNVALNRLLRVQFLRNFACKDGRYNLVHRFWVYPNYSYPIMRFGVVGERSCSSQTSGMLSEVSGGDGGNGHDLCASDEVDIEKVFLSDKVQNLLYELSEPNPDIVFQPRPVELRSLSAYRIMRKDEVEKVQAVYDEGLSREKMRCPPVMRERSEVEQVLQEDEKLNKFDYCKHVIIDISPSHNDKSRYIMVREPTGTLRTANWDERDRMTRIFYPKYKREIRVPRMFRGEFLEKIVRRKKYEYVLERAFVQFEPDSADFIRVTQRVYEEVESEGDFSALSSTRWFGCLVFYLIRTRRVARLLLYYLKRRRLDKCVELATLYSILHPSSNLSDLLSSTDTSQIDVVKKFVSQYGGAETGEIEEILISMEEVQSHV